MEFECNKCYETKSVVEFHRRMNTRGYDYTCRKCRNKIHNAKGYNYRAKYYAGVTQDVELPVFDGTCSICKKVIEGKDKHLDHDHLTGKLRGWLCHSCNVGLGHFKDNIELLEQAVRYLYLARSEEQSSVRGA